MSATGTSPEWQSAGFDDFNRGLFRTGSNQGTHIMATEILVPQLGNEVTEAEVTEWAAAVGDSECR